MDNDGQGRVARQCCNTEEPDPCKMCRGLAGHRVMNSEELLQGDRELFIIHSGQIYRLLRTRNDKLILQK